MPTKTGIAVSRDARGEAAPPLVQHLHGKRGGPLDPGLPLRQRSPDPSARA